MRELWLVSAGVHSLVMASLSTAQAMIANYVPVELLFNHLVIESVCTTWQCGLLSLCMLRA